MRPRYDGAVRMFSRWLTERGGLVVLAVFLMYAWVAPAHLSIEDDNAEFSTLGAIGGAAHPTGYPLYVMWLRLWSWLPAETPAHAAALATCILGAASILVLHAACRAWGASSIAASFAVALAAAMPLVVRLHTAAEVFALNGLVAGSVLWLSAQHGPLRGLWRAFTLGLVAGLGLSDHVTCVLFAPVGILGVVRGARESGYAARAVGLATLGLVLGLLPYSYLLLVPETRGSWGKVEDLRGLLYHFLRMDYGGPGAFSPRDVGGSPLGHIADLMATHLRGWLWAPFALGLVALVVRCVRSEQGESRVGWWMFSASWLLAGVVLVSKFNLPPSYVTHRFHMLPVLVFAVPVALGLDLVGRRLPLQRSQIIGSAWGSTLGASLLSIALIAVALPSIATARSPATEQAVKNMLRTLPPNAVVIGSPDQFHFGMAYVQGALGERPDVTTITWTQMGLNYARERLARQTGIVLTELQQNSTEKLSVLVAREVLASGRPLFIDPYAVNIATSFPIYPYGLVFRVLPTGTALPSLDELFEINDELYRKYEFGYPKPTGDEGFITTIHDHYARPWLIIANAMGAAGNKDKQNYALGMAVAVGPVRESPPAMPAADK